MNRLVFALVLFFPCLAFGQTPLESVKVEGHLDWDKGNFVLDLTVPVAKDSNVLPVNRFRTETFLADNLKELMLRGLFPLRLDSSRTIHDLTVDDPGLFLPLENLTQDLTQNYSRASSGYESLTIRYTLPIYGKLMDVLATNRVAPPDPAPFGYFPSLAYTGLVIFVPEDVPGGPLVPALFPRLWGKTQDLLLDERRMKPEFLRKWGAMTYATGFDEGPFQQRIGKAPLRIVAAGLQGQVPTDLVISLQDQNRLLYNEKNREILAEGRILVIMGKKP